MAIRSCPYAVDMAHYPSPGSLDEQGLGRPILELRDTWGRYVLMATKALALGGGNPSTVCPCGSSKKPCPGRVVIGAGRNSNLVAMCDRCRFQVSITGWSGSWWDWTMGAPFAPGSGPTRT
jgi:hypothetical protein